MVAAFLASVGIPANAVAQSCGVAIGRDLAVAVGWASWDVAESAGPSVGADFATSFRAVPLEVRAGARGTLLDGADALMVRAVAAAPIPVPYLGRFRLCGTVHGGASRVSPEGWDATSLAGGIGLRLAGSLGIPGGNGTGARRVEPYLEVRGLGAWTTGTLFGAELGKGGLSVGGAAGVTAAVGRVTVRAAGTVDGFDPGLGFTPYPALAAELAVGYRF